MFKWSKPLLLRFPPPDEKITPAKFSISPTGGGNYPLPPPPLNNIWKTGLSGTMVPRLDMCRSIISLNRITHQMWRDHKFSQRNKATKRAVGWRLRRGVGQNLKNNTHVQKVEHTSEFLFGIY